MENISFNPNTIKTTYSTYGGEVKVIQFGGITDFIKWSNKRARGETDCMVFISNEKI